MAGGAWMKPRASPLIFPVFGNGRRSGLGRSGHAKVYLKDPVRREVGIGRIAEHRVAEAQVGLPGRSLGLDASIQITDKRAARRLLPKLAEVDDPVVEMRDPLYEREVPA